MAIQFTNIGSGQVRDQGRTDAAAGKDARPAPPPQSPDGASQGRRSDVQLSDNAKKIRELTDKTSKEPAVDKGRVEHIRQAIAEGRYHVDPVRLAQKFIEFESQL